jgi:PleD family two-component response regulator
MAIRGDSPKNPVKVLIVDDDAIVREDINLILRRHGYQVLGLLLPAAMQFSWRKKIHQI